MEPNRKYRSWRSAAQSLVGIVGVSLLTFVCFRLDARAGISALLYLAVVVVLAGTDAFVPSVIVSVVAVVCLDYFFIPPIFSLELANPLDIVALFAFLGTAWLITHQLARR